MKLSTIQRDGLKKIGKKHKLKMILLHGSYAIGKQSVGSDLDVAILGKDEIGFDKLLEISSELSRIFKNTKNRELDVKSLHKANPLFLYQVMNNSKLLYGKRDDYDQLRAYAYKLYHDSKSLFGLESKLVGRYQKYLSKNYA